ncbi:histidine phosphatase family protein [Prauserella muralis]|uniref:Phosphoglycerate mutase n=1 Tax=Prauserella muralis TaxID=588067 RepID=A0A2V4B796_9PSEU|nr:histidine phosphatase family protein [Prauserella muralis]PXY31138.1 phosphoglycerate mutase [Prauserella muralis]TWE14569.1 putative phosphoglycerate mutase [Prauserella muralis]
MSVRLLLARHGETEWHAENRYAGTSDVALTARGAAQADALAQHVRTLAEPPAALYCSPQPRALRTAEPSAKALGLVPSVAGDLREVHFGIAEGRTLAEVRADDPAAAEAFAADPVAGAFPGAEPPGEAAERGAAALRAIAETEAGPVLVVAHNTLLRLTLCLLLGIPLREYRVVLPRLENCALTEIRVDGTRTSLLRLNLPTG